MGLFAAPVALIIDRIFGYPDALFQRIGHPVTWIGALIAWLDRTLNHKGRGRAWGVLALFAIIGAALLVTLPIAVLCRSLPFGFLLEGLLASSLIAQKSLRDHVAAVAEGLARSLPEGRAKVAMIVGRDPETLDEAGVARAAIESLAESSSDGVIAPLFWLLLFGLPGIAIYKAVNTADSMIGHKTERHLMFGWAAARFDDLLNLIPARLSALLIALAAALTPGASPRAALATALSDARKHDSPNAGWPEAGFAGALGFRLGGPRSYQGEVIDLPSFGTGRSHLGAGDIVTALRLYTRLTDMTLALAIGLAAAALLS
jgi:adenosylcobinamide-phosphate synthase